MSEHPEYHHKSSIQSDGSRPKIRIADVVGKFTTAKNGVFSVLLVVFFVLPWIKIGAERLVFLWIERREFTLFTFTFNAQDVYLTFFLITGLGFLLFFITALVGRIWCGWICPQTVFLEGLFRKIERWIEGSRSEQLKLEKSPMTFKKLRKAVAKHFLFVVLSLLIATTFIMYFVPGEYLIDLWTQGPGSHGMMLSWIIFLAGALYFDFSWFREQVCLILCPYGRLQSALMDDDSLVIGYDRLRGEPRAKTKADGAGDCIDCGRCVAVCPTGIDIRAGLQMECIGCANCIDACDEIMTKMDRPVGLIRYDSFNGLERKPKRILRSRIYLYVFLMVVGATVAFFTMREHTTFEANILRLAGAPFILDAGKVRNQFEMHVVNKTNKSEVFIIKMINGGDVQAIFPISRIELEPRQDRRIPWMALVEQSQFKQDFELELQIQKESSGERIERKVQFLGPK
ncbi:MAG: cytochrome c oxidase accessory protein CcoG [Proteobacteria bacterium]|nr:cytochrome c oxidase accessory protein CcoG [Pseudomonadota bacterium]